MDYDYEEELKKRLAKDRWLRNLFNKLGTEVLVVTKTDQHIIGILKTIQFSRNIINLEVHNQNGSYFINWKNVQYLRGQKV